MPLHPCPRSHIRTQVSLPAPFLPPRRGVPAWPALRSQRTAVSVPCHRYRPVPLTVLLRRWPTVKRRKPGGCAASCPSGQTESYFKMTDANAIRFNIAFILWCALFLALGGVGLAALAAIDRLPAPPVTATNCIDEKFKFLHETEIRNPGLLAVGS